MLSIRNRREAQRIARYLSGVAPESYRSALDWLVDYYCESSGMSRAERVAFYYYTDALASERTQAYGGERVG